MGIAAIENDYLTRSFRSAVGKETTSFVSETESFGQKLQAETEKKCPYSFWAKYGSLTNPSKLSVTFKSVKIGP